MFPLAYVAGILDGEGSISIRNQAPHHNFQIRIVVVNTFLPLLKNLQEQFAGSIYQRKPIGLSKKECYEWVSTGNQAEGILKQLLPYLLIKRKQAELAIFAWANRQAAPRKKRREPVPKPILDFRAASYAQMKQLNGRYTGG